MSTADEKYLGIRGASSLLRNPAHDRLILLFFLFGFAVLVAAGWLWTRHQAPLSARAFVSGIPTLEPDMKLVVAHLDLVKSASAESPKAFWGVDCGTTKVALSVPARVHFAIDLSGPRPVEFKAEGGMIVAVFPDPSVQAVEIFAQEKRTITEVGWARLRQFSGLSLEEDLERGLYDGVKADASAPRTLAQVKEQARPTLERLVAAYARASGRAGAQVVVRFSSDRAAALEQTAMN